MFCFFATKAAVTAGWKIICPGTPLNNTSQSQTHNTTMWHFSRLHMNKVLHNVLLYSTCTCFEYNPSSVSAFLILLNHWHLEQEISHPLNHQHFSCPSLSSPFLPWEAHGVEASPASWWTSCRRGKLHVRWSGDYYTQREWGWGWRRVERGNR